MKFSIDRLKFWRYFFSKDGNVTTKDELLNLDYLVFSSHKTATQTLTHTLNRSGFNCKHCHHLPNINLKKGEFQPYLESYFKRNNRKLNVITVFRDPLSRQISSFFQFYGSRPLHRNEVANKYETIIYQYSIDQLISEFTSRLQDTTSFGYTESIYDICEELEIDIEKLTYNTETHLGVYETDRIRLHILRFDVFITHMETLLKNITGTNIKMKKANVTKHKWYHEIYKQFKLSLSLPHDTILEVYNAKRDLINLLYPDQYETIVNRALTQYGRD